jgi:hypothetical protein
LALNKPTKQSSQFNVFASDKAVDGNINGDLNNGLSCTHTNNDVNPWWAVDLEFAQDIIGGAIVNREDCCRKIYFPILLIKNPHLQKKTQLFFDWLFMN